jgi:RluA family pseudouridine synthase
VVNKPAGLASQPTLTSRFDSLICEISKLKNLPESRFLMVHRLDKDTSGLIILALNKDAQSHFENLFRQKNIEKEYLAICSGIPKSTKFEVNYSIAKHANRPNTYVPVFSSQKMSQRSREAKECLTHFEMLAADKLKGVSLLKCMPKTGRTHQIRVHALSVGLPLLGDKTYSQNVLSANLRSAALRHMLHAFNLKFVGPDSTSYSFSALPPPDFMECMLKLNLNVSLE